MTIYAVAPGHNNTGGLAPLDPQPSSVGTVPGRRVYDGAGGYYEDMQHVELTWNVLDGSEAYRNLLIQLGLANDNHQLVTLRIRDDNFLDWEINATVHRPEHGRELGWRFPFPSPLTIIATRLSEVT